MESVSLYSEARNEYLKQLSIWIIPHMVEFFRREYSTISAKEGRRAMVSFQSWCSEVPRWNQDVIDVNVNHLLDTCRCDYVEELMTAVFIAHTKMLTAIRVSSKKKKLQITLPKLDHFLHRVFVECARAFWKAPFLFSEELSPIERQKNVLQAESMCMEALSSAVRSLLPIKSILRDNLEDDEEEEEKPKKSKRKVSDSSSDSSDSSDSEDEVPRKKGGAPKMTVEEIVELNIPVVAPVPEQPKPEPVIVETKPEPVIVEETKPVVEEIKPEPVIIETKPDVPAPPPPSPEVERVLSVTELPKGPILTKLEAPEKEPEPVEIDTEPSVHFSPYEMVFDVPETHWGPPKDTYDEDEDGEPRPKISFSGEESALSSQEIEEIGITEEESVVLGDGDFESV
jgi:hypothetical protein